MNQDAGDAGTDPQRGIGVGRCEIVGDHLEHDGTVIEVVAAADPVHQDSELTTAEASDGIEGLHGLERGPREADDQLVAARVPKPLPVAVETGELQHGDADALPLVLGLVDRFLDKHLDALGVPDTGERVDHDRSPALADVREHALFGARGAGCVEQHLGEQGHLAEQRDLSLIERARLKADDAQRCDGLPVGGVHRRAGIEHDARVARHQLAVAEVLVEAGVGDNGNAVKTDRSLAEGDAPQRLLNLEPLDRLEPLAVAINK